MPITMHKFSASGIIIGLHPSDKKTNSSENISIGFPINDFSEVKKICINYPLSIMKEKNKGGNFIHFKDPDGTPLYLQLVHAITSSGLTNRLTLYFKFGER